MATSNVDDIEGQICHEHLKLVTNTSNLSPKPYGCQLGHKLHLDTPINQCWLVTDGSHDRNEMQIRLKSFSNICLPFF